MAAVLATGPGSALSHPSAVALWGLRPHVPGVTHVTAPRRRRPPRLVIVHRSPLPADELTVELGIPVTTVARTLFDFASCAPRTQVELAINEAERRRLGDSLSLPELIERYPRHRGVRVLRDVVGDGWVGRGMTRSVLEERFLKFVVEADLPSPEINASLPVGDGWVEVDLLWRSARLIVELDGHAFHAGRAAYERDRARDRALSVAGWRVIRVTWRQLVHEPFALAADLRTLLNQREAR
jgi:very-short-patch-repair endonuclease